MLLSSNWLDENPRSNNIKSNLCLSKFNWSIFLKFALWNPLFHAIELTRSAASESYIIVNEISLSFLMESTFIALFFAIVIYSKNQDLLLKS